MMLLQSTSMLSSSLAALSLRACSSLRFASTTAAAVAAAGNATAATTKRRRRSRADEVVVDASSADSTSSTSASSSSSSSPDAWRASLPDDAPATALAAALRRSLALTGTKPESALVFVADRARTAEDAAAAFDAAAALRAARVRRGQRGELRSRVAHAALASAAVRAAAAEILGGGGGGAAKQGGSEASGGEGEVALSRLLASTLGRARQAGMPVGAKTFSDAAWALQRAVKREAAPDAAAAPEEAPLLASAARGVLAASLACRVKPTPRLAAALVNASAAAGGEGGARAAEALAAEFEANGVRLGPFALKALERARSGAAGSAAPTSAAAAEEGAAEEGGKGE